MSEPPASPGHGLVYAFQLDGAGGGRAIGWEEIDEPPAEGAVVWIHIDRAEARARTWLSGRSGLDSAIVDALLAAETRPRFTEMPGGILLNLRGVNLNPGADPEDMVSVRFWIEGMRVITVRNRRVMAAADIAAEIGRGVGPGTVGMLISSFAAKLVERMGPVLAELDDRIDGLEDEAVMGEDIPRLRRQLMDIRREAIALRRYIAPQREALARLASQSVAQIEDRDRLRLREATDTVMRYVEDLDLSRDRAAVIQDELVNRVAEHMNRNMLVLSVVAALFLPLGFLTGLLGINVGGIPGADAPLGFLAVTLFLALIAGAEILLFKRIGWV